MTSRFMSKRQDFTVLHDQFIHTASKIHLISGIEGRLPFSLDDASRPDTEIAAPDAQFNRVLLDTRLNNRIIDLRVSLCPFSCSWLLIRT